MAFKYFAVIFFLVVADCYLGSAQKLIWSEEFNDPAGTRPDPESWNFHVGDGTGQGLPGWGNSELEYYTKDAANSATDGNGNLVITALSDGASDHNCYYGPCKYTSARLFTNCKFTQQYGRVEIRLKAPSGQGLWPAVWLLGDDYDSVGWPDSGEIDVFELKGSDPTTVFGSIHGPGYSGSDGLTTTYTLPNGQSFADDFHVFAIDWAPDTISWSVDDQVYETHTPDDTKGNPWVFNHPFYFLVNLAVGGNFDGNPVNVEFPQTLTIDYIRVYEN